MRSRSRILTIIFLVLCVIVKSHALAEEQSEIIRNVEKLEELFSDGWATGDLTFRHVVFGKFFGHKRDDAVVLFSVGGFSGGSSHSEYIAFFAALDREDWAGSGHQPHQYSLVAVREIGGRWWRTFESKKMKVKHDHIILTGKAWAQTDSGCCPSLPITAKFAVQKGNVVELH